MACPCSPRAAKSGACKAVARYGFTGSQGRAIRSSPLKRASATIPHAKMPALERQGRAFVQNSPSSPTTTPQMARRYAFLWAFLLLLACPLQAQELYHKIYNIQSELPTDMVYDVVEDPKGFLYIGTNRGIFRFNGKQFTRLTVLHSKEQTFTDLVVDPDGALWARNFSNQIFKTTANDTLYSITEHLGLFTDSLPTLRLRGKGEFIYIANKLDVLQVHCRTYASEHRISVGSEEIFAGLEIGDFLVDAWGAVYAQTQYGVLYQHSKKKEIEWAFAPSSSQKILLCYGLDSFGEEALFCTNSYADTTSVYRLQQGASFLYASAHNPQTKTFQTLNGTDTTVVWFCTATGLYRWDIRSEKIEALLPPNFYTAKILRDHEGGYWVATLGNGLVHIPNLNAHKIAEPQTQFSTFAPLPEGEIAVGTNASEVLRIDSLGTVKFRYTMPSNRTLDFLTYDKQKQRLYHSLGYHDWQQSSISQRAPLGKGITRLDSLHLLVCAEKGLQLAHEDINKPSAYPSDGLTFCDSYAGDQEQKNYALLLQKGSARAVRSTRSTGRIFAAFTNNLVCFDIRKKYHSVKVLSPAQRSIHCSAMTSQGDTIWIASFQDGVMGIDSRNLNVFAQYTSNEGLSSNECSYLHIHKKELWVITANGINKISLESGEIEHIGHQYALGNAVPKEILVDDRFIWLNFGSEILRLSRNGYQKPIPRAVVLRKFEHDGVSYPIKRRLIFPPINKQFFLEIELPTYRYTTSTFCQYKLLPIDSAWQDLPIGEYKIPIPLLAHGNYTLELRAKNHCCVGTTQRIFFEIRPPIWRTTGFLLAILALLLFALYFAIWAFVKRQWGYRQLHEQATNHELAALRARMNPHFMYNALNTIQALVLTNQQDLATSVIGNFSQLTRSILYMSGQENTNLRAELEMLVNYTKIEKVRMGETLNISIEQYIPKYLSTDQIILPSILIQPMVENALKHGLMHRKGSKFLTLKFIVTPPIGGSKKKLHYLSVLVVDNGIGRKASRTLNARTAAMKTQQSFATMAMYQRLTLLNRLRKTPISYRVRDHYNDKREALGTSIRVDIPFYPRI